MKGVRERAQMIAQMAPRLDDQVWHFCATDDPGALATSALARFDEDEGCSLILRHDEAQGAGLDRSLPMARITLQVHSALDGVGLTAAVATTLAEAGIACNMVAAFHHDHAFVPWSKRNEALELLKGLSRMEDT